MKQDVKLAAKLIQMLDDRWSLWHDQTEEKKDKEKEVDRTSDVMLQILHLVFLYIFYKKIHLLSICDELMINIFGF